MNTIRTLALLLLTAIGLGTSYGQLQPAAAPEGPSVPKFADILKYRPNNIVIYSPIRMAASHTLNFTHIRLADGSVRPGTEAGVMLIIYASKPDVNGDHPVLFQDFHFLGKTADPVLNFKPYNPTNDSPGGIDNDNRAGIIAVLIGLLRQPNRTTDWMQAPLPPLDTISGAITPGDTSIGLLLPAVQKVREAARR